MREIKVNCSQDVFDLAEKYGKDNIKFRYVEGCLLEGINREGEFNLIEKGQVRTNEYDLFLDSNSGECGLLQFSQFVVLVPDYTFDDLIDVATKAVRDGVLSRYTFYTHEDGINVIGLQFGERLNQIYSGNEEQGIDWINSLYTETFVIESDKDIKNLNYEPNVTLANGNEFVAKSMKILKNPRGMFAIEFLDVDGYLMTYSFFELKGATVTQKRVK